MRAHGYGPKRLVDLKDESVSYLGIAEKSTRPVELVVRIDRTQSSRGPKAFQVFGSSDDMTDSSPSGGNGSHPEVPSTPVEASTVESMTRDYLA